MQGVPVPIPFPAGFKKEISGSGNQVGRKSRGIGTWIMNF
jgi:hypothetical protein